MEYSRKVTKFHPENPSPSTEYFQFQWNSREIYLARSKGYLPCDKTRPVDALGNSIGFPGMKEEVQFARLLRAYITGSPVTTDEIENSLAIWNTFLCDEHLKFVSFGRNPEIKAIILKRIESSGIWRFETYDEEWLEGAVEWIEIFDAIYWFETEYLGIDLGN